MLVRGSLPTPVSSDFPTDWGLYPVDTAKSRSLIHPRIHDTMLLYLKLYRMCYVKTLMHAATEKSNK